jgi:hypothetical protein
MCKRFLAMLLILSFPLAAFPADLTEDEQSVWDLEVAYWEYVKANDIPGYRSLWDERFIGWPGFSEQPLGKENIHEWVTDHRDPGIGVEYELTLGSVRAHGNIVAAHYLVRYSRRSPETGEMIGDEIVSRITHTWQRQGDTWRIVTGMSGSWIGE